MENKKFKDWNIVKLSKSFYICRVFVPVFIVLVLIYLYNDNYYIFHQFIEVLCATLGAALAIISIAKDNTNCKDLFENIGIGFGLISMIEIVHILVFKYTNYLTDGININTYIWIIINYIEYFIILIAFYARKKNIMKKKFLMIYMVITIVIFSILGATYVFNNIINSILSYKYFFLVNNLILTAIFIVNLIIIINNRKNISKKQFYYLLVYIILVYIYEFFMGSFFTEYNKTEQNFILIAHIFKYFAYYIIYEAMSEFVVNKNYDSMYNELVFMKKNNEYYNRKLSERMKILLELNSMVNKSKNKYTELINTIHESILIFNNEKLFYANEAAINLLQVDEFLRRYIKKMNFMKYIKNNNKEFNEEGSSLEDKFYTDLTFIKRDGQELYIDLYIIEFENNISLWFIKDITERKNIKTLKGELVKYLQEEKLKSEFFSNISHELRTPINVIYSALQLNDVYLTPENYEGIKNNNTIIRQNCLRLIRTINNFIDANKISDGYLSPNLMIYNIVEVVENVAQASFKFINKMGVSLIFDSDEEDILVCCDREFVERIMLNLLSNCVKYGRKGGHIWVDIKLRADKVDISIENDGYQIDEEEKSYIFDKFTKTNKSLNRPQEGSGLGLFITKSLAEIQKGTIKLQYSNNGGEAFVVTFNRCNDSNYYKEQKSEDILMNELSEKVDIEFSDIYL